VIGTGPGGEGAAMQGVKLGSSVAAVERMSSIGGSCTHKGTIPSKALRFAVYQVTSLSQSNLLNFEQLNDARSFPNLRKSAGSVIAKQVNMRQGFYERNGIPVFQGQARLTSPTTVEVEDELGGKRILEANSIIIATGSRPFRHDALRPSIAKLLAGKQWTGRLGPDRHRSRHRPAATHVRLVL